MDRRPTAEYNEDLASTAFNYERDNLPEPVSGTEERALQVVPDGKGPFAIEFFLATCAPLAPSVQDKFAGKR